MSKMSFDFFDVHDDADHGFFFKARTCLRMSLVSLKSGKSIYIVGWRYFELYSDPDKFVFTRLILSVIHVNLMKLICFQYTN